eukprot:5192005-Amphidinium_carterae.1
MGVRPHHMCTHGLTLHINAVTPFGKSGMSDSFLTREPWIHTTSAGGTWPSKVLEAAPTSVSRGPIGFVRTSAASCLMGNTGDESYVVSRPLPCCSNA